MRGQLQRLGIACVWNETNDVLHVYGFSNLPEQMADMELIGTKHQHLIVFNGE